MPLTFRDILQIWRMMGMMLLCLSPLIIAFAAFVLLGVPWLVRTFG